MYELVYCSKASPDLTHEDILSILETAKKFNSENNITGCLLYYNQEFAQILEGERDVVMSLYEKIKKDKRHTFVVLLGTGNKPNRHFADWSMAYKDLDNEVETTLKSDFMKNIECFSDYSNNPSHVTAMFHDVSKLIVEDGLDRR